MNINSNGEIGEEINEEAKSFRDETEDVKQETIEDLVAADMIAEDIVRQPLTSGDLTPQEGVISPNFAGASLKEVKFPVSYPKLI